MLLGRVYETTHKVDDRIKLDNLAARDDGALFRQSKCEVKDAESTLAIISLNNTFIDAKNLRILIVGRDPNLALRLNIRALIRAGTLRLPASASVSTPLVNCSSLPLLGFALYGDNHLLFLFHIFFGPNLYFYVYFIYFFFEFFSM